MTTRTSGIFTFAYTVLLGFVSGVVGGLVIADRLLTPAAPAGVSYSVLRKPADNNAADQAVVVADSVLRSSVAFFVKKDRIADPVRAAYLPGEAVAHGAVLTTDGWLVSHVGGFTAKNVRYVAVIGTKAYDAKLVARDPYANLQFLKIDAANLTAVPFGDDAGMAIGEQGYGLDSGGGVRGTPLLAHDGAPPTTADDLIHSSEKAQTMLRFADASFLPGTALFDRRGALAGIVSGRVKDAVIAVPIEAFSRTVPDVLRTGAATRPLLGVRYADLSRLMSGAADAETVRGALLKPSLDGRLPAVVPGGPAAKGGLRQGDVILAIDDDLVTAKNGLADIVAEYKPGTAVTVRYRRGEEEKTANVVLGSTTP